MALPTGAAWSEPESDGAKHAPRGTAFLAGVAADGEAKTVDRLHAADEDPWILVEELLLLGKKDVALRVSRAGWSVDDSALTDYAQRATPGSVALAQRVVQAEKRLDEGDGEGALKLVAEATGAGLNVTQIRALRVRARALEATEAAKAAGVMRARLARRAGVLGWRRAEDAVLRVMLGRLGPQGSPDSKHRILSRLLAIDQDARDLERSARWCLELGYLQAVRQQPQLARRSLIEAESLLEVLAVSPGLSRELHQQRARGLAQLADVHLTLGNPAAGIDTAFRAYDMSQATGPRVRYFTARTLGKAYLALGDPVKAETYYREAVKQATSELPEIAVLLKGDLAHLLLRLGKREEANRLYDEVLTSARSNKSDRRPYYVVRLHLADRWINHPADTDRVPDLQRALLDLFDMLESLEAEPAGFTARPEVEANTQALAGRALNLLRRSKEAEPILREALQSAYASSIPGFQQFLRRELAHAVRASGNPKEALELTRTAIKGLRKDVASLPGQYALSVLSPSGNGELIDEHVASALALSSPHEVIDALEATRGMAFLSEVRRRKRSGARMRLESQQDSIASLAAGVAQAAQSFWRASQRDRQASLRAKKELWERRRELRDVRGRRELERERDARLEDAPRAGPLVPLPMRRAKALRRDEAMLYIARADAQYIAVLEVAERVYVERLGPCDTVDEELLDARATWIDPEVKEHAPELARMISVALPQAVLSRLMAKREPPHQSVAHLYVSVSGAFAMLPWPVMVEAAYAKTRPSGSTAPTVTLVASQGVLQHLRRFNLPFQGGALLALGDPDYTAGRDRRTQMAVFGQKLLRLKQSGLEVKELVDPDRGDLMLLGADASKAVLSRCLFDSPYPFDVLHLSCHGILYSPVPWMSALALHPTATDDGLLTVEDIGRWQFPSGPRLVVLAACNSGLGSPVPGEGEDGLVRAFLLAGARHVVASFWKVPDDTSRRIMVAFHKYMREGKLTPALALRRAQQDVRADAKGMAAHPWSWAGWAVWGPRD